MADDLSSWRFCARMKPEGSQHSLYKLDVACRLFVVPLELLAQVVVLHATERSLVNRHTAEFGLKRLVEQLIQLFVVHRPSPFSPRCARPGTAIPNSGSGSQMCRTSQQCLLRTFYGGSRATLARSRPQASSRQ